MSSKVKTQFVNTSNIKTSVKGIMSIIKKMRETPRRYPDHPIQVAVENYSNLQNGQYVWFGHDSLMFKLNNKIIMVDPIFHNAALAKPFKYTQTFDLSLFPIIDCLILTHSHYDHICKQTLKLLKVLTVFTPLNNNTKHINSILKNAEIHKLDWFQSYSYEDLKFTCVPGQHFSARTGCDRNESLWGGFCINNRVPRRTSLCKNCFGFELYFNAYICIYSLSFLSVYFFQFFHTTQDIEKILITHYTQLTEDWYLSLQLEIK
ncbi:Beta-lactamase_superfamily domain-containing protein [Hexamita inflata]|uniref:Beta-lactamase superfamily domain-containing protein n=1 Tax=Hexamita inflata TaxID=28002 RepID=A0AA86P979_9EUKA|nr:Beta-lactamase superfamily domain-containing protein [Hexamita inflata]